MKEADIKLIGPFSQILPMDGLPLKGALEDDQLTIIYNGGILVERGNILQVDDYGNINAKIGRDIPRISVAENTVVLPGLIDAHTHICFAGSRSIDYAARNAGKSYLEISAAGGGIWNTVLSTREASKQVLEELMFQRVKRLLDNGVTTIEIKSGYGLSIVSELKMLETIQAVSNQVVADLIPTCLAAHTVPKEMKGAPKKYLDYLLVGLIPQMLERKLTNRVDIFIEQGAFSPELSFSYLEKCKSLGLDITVHGDQFSPGGSQVAVDVGAVSVDHLEASSEKEIQLIASSNTVAVALPGASLGLGCSFTPARRLLDSGACLAIASDWNPGSAPMGHLLLQASVLGAFQKLTNAEVLAGITFRAAKALNLSDRGRIAKGQLADFVVFPTSDYREILYKQGMLEPCQVWKRGVNIL